MTHILIDIIVMSAVTIVFMFVLAAFANRILRVRIGIGRLILAGLFGLGALAGFESQFVWGKSEYTPALIPVQVGIVFFVSIGFLVIAELIVPPGSIPRPDQWPALVRARISRSRRYFQLSRIAFKNKLVPFKPATENTMAAATERKRQAKALRAALEEAGGAFVKLGQMLSTRNDLLSVEFLDELSSLQQSVAPADPQAIKALVEEELKRPLDAVFSEFELTPLASASIGQVHQATLLDGQRVAVKVQRPQIEELIERDTDIATRLATKLEGSMQWARDLGLKDLATSFTGGLIEELDYRGELRNMKAMFITQSSKPASSRLRIPRFFAEFSTKKILVMELVSGETLSNPQTLERLGPVRRKEIARQLLGSMLTQIVDDGVFHADLHPGNIIINSEGELMLLDYGSVGRLDSATRARIAHVLMAFSRGDSADFTDALLEFVDISDDVDEPRLRRRIAEFVANRLGPGSSVDVEVFNEMLLILTKSKISVPSELTAAFRAMAVLEGTLRYLDPGFDFLSEAEAVAKGRIQESLAPGAVFKSVKDEVESLLPLLRGMPAKVDAAISTFAEGRTKVNMRLFADPRDRSLVSGLVNLASLAFLAGAFGLMAVVLLVSEAGPEITETLTLFQIFGYLLVVLSGLLTLRVLFETLRVKNR